MTPSRDLVDHDEAGAGAASFAPTTVLAAVKEEGLKRRTRRRRRNAALGGLAATLIAIPALALWLGGSDGSARVTVAADGEAADDDADRTSEATVPSTTLAATAPTTEVVDTGSTEATTAPVVSPPVAPPTSAPATVCIDSTDPACGEFVWDPAPGPNQPLVLTTPEVITMQPGQSTTIEVHWSDADAPLSFEWFSSDGVELIESCQQSPRFGPWTPPPPGPASGTLAYAYTAPAEPGSYDVAVYAFAGREVGGSYGCGADPYESSARIVVTVNVVPPAP